MPGSRALLIVMSILAGLAGPAQGQGRKVPYWASISQSEARMRVGPSTDYPASWIYRRRDLPVKVLVVYQNWRKVEDPDGTQGWMHVSQLSAAPTGMIVGGVAPLKASPDKDAATLFRAEPGVVGRLSDCGSGWCRFDVQGQRGYVQTSRLWGAIE